MKKLLILICFCLVSCRAEQVDLQNKVRNISFDSEKWQETSDVIYPFRATMVDEILYTDTIRGMSKNQVIEVLGDLDRVEQNHFYYLISQKKLGNWPMTTKTLVIKLNNNDGVEWVKLHG